MQCPSSCILEAFLDCRLQIRDRPGSWRELQHSILRPGDEVGSGGKRGLRSGRTVFDGNTLLRLKPHQRRRPLIRLRVRLAPHHVIDRYRNKPGLFQAQHPDEFWFSERRNLAAAKRFLRKALKRHGRPERIVIDGSQTNRKAILSCDAESRLQDRSRRQLKPIGIRQSQYLNNRIEQDHRAIKRRVRSMLGFKSMSSARVTLSGIEMVHMMRKGQAKYACHSNLSLAEQFERLAA